MNSAETNPTFEPTGLAALFDSRYHGAANIRGIHYQIVYSVSRALHLRHEEGASIQLEGIEDLDLIGLRVSDEYIQVKTAGTPWSGARLKGPVEGFLKALRSNEDGQFRLVVNFALQADLARLAEYPQLSPPERKRVAKKFRKLCKAVGGSEAEASTLLERLQVESISDEELERGVREDLTEAFGLGTCAAGTYMYVLVSRFLEWAGDREEISWQRVEELRSSVGEALTREAQFQAFGSTLIDSLSWSVDATESDFFEAKGARPGHVAAGLDVPRPKWLERIGQAIAASKVCVLRASSGQGKSTLLYRFAFENWPRKHTFIVQAAESEEQAGQIVAFVRHRVDVGLPVFILLDNANWSTRCWSTIARACSSLGVPMLASTRTEDWHRFGRDTATTYEILEPDLDTPEAHELYDAFAGKGRLHESVLSAEWAIEKIGSPLLLIEFVYLLTHGQMLEERLREQITEISRQQEDGAKVEIIRRLAVAHTLGSPVHSGELFSQLSTRDDPQQLLKSLSGEYLTIDGNNIEGLHWVRSNHLVTILHEGGRSPDETALAVLDAIPDSASRAFVANALSRPGAEWQSMLTRVSASRPPLRRMLHYAQGAFDAGERSYFEGNRELFTEAYDELGMAGPLLLSTKVLPSLHLDTIDQLAETMGDKAHGFQKLKAIADRFGEDPRGRDYCRHLLAAAKFQVEEVTEESIAETGELLDWLTFCELSFEHWDALSRQIIDGDRLLSLPFHDVCRFLQGIYRYDRDAYDVFERKARVELFGYLKLNTDTISLDLASDGVLRAEFIVDGNQSADSGNEQAVSRLTAFRTALPYCKRFDSVGIWLLPAGLEPSIDNTTKKILPENLPARADVGRNVVWRTTVENAFLPDSFYEFQASLIGTRREVLQFLKVLISGLELAFAGRSADDSSGLEGGALSARVMKGLARLPAPPPQTPSDVATLLRAGLREWAGPLQNYVGQVGTFTNDPSNREAGRLAAHNFRDALKHLAGMHAAFEELFSVASDYFAAREMNVEEIRLYASMEELLDPWLVDPISTAQRDIYKYVRSKRAESLRRDLRKLKEALDPITASGATVILPSNICYRHPLHYVPVAFSVADPCDMQPELELLLRQLVNVQEIGEYFCLVPLAEGKRFLDGGFVIPARDMSSIADGSFDRWETTVPRDLPAGALECLPEFDVARCVRLQLLESVTVLVCAVDVAARYGGIVAEMSEQTVHEVQLKENYMRRVEKLQGEATEGVLTVRVLLDSGPFVQSSSAFVNLHTELESIEAEGWAYAEILMADDGAFVLEQLKMILSESTYR